MDYRLPIWLWSQTLMLEAVSQNNSHGQSLKYFRLIWSMRAKAKQLEAPGKIQKWKWMMACGDHFSALTGSLEMMMLYYIYILLFQILSINTVGITNRQYTQFWADTPIHKCSFLTIEDNDNERVFLCGVVSILTRLDQVFRQIHISKGHRLQLFLNWKWMSWKNELFLVWRLICNR